MKKILTSLIALIIFTSVLVVNVSAETDYKYDKEEVIKSVEKLVKKLVGMNEEELKYYVGNSVGWTKKASETLLDYHENGALGQYKSIGDAELVEDGQLLKITIVAEYDKANLKIVTTMANISEEIITTQIDFKLIDTGNETLGERMQNALFNALIGITSVFLVLMLISFIIYLFKYIPKLQERFSRKDNDLSSSTVENTISQIEKYEELVDDMELVAVITAAICAATGKSGDSFVVRSIKKADRKKKRI